MFQKYQHIERYGTIETNGIDMGECYVFPKIDGTNGCVWNDNNNVMCGSRNRTLTLDNDNQGFMAFILKQQNIISFIQENKNLILYGEWLVPHTLKTYREDAWKKFYVFDVFDLEKQDYLHYEQYKILLEEYDILYIPALCKIKMPSYERLLYFVNSNTYLIEDGRGSGEGIVIKNYDYTNRFGRKTWAKIVKNEFKDKHIREGETREVKEKKLVEDEIIDNYMTPVLIKKEYAKIVNEQEGWSSKFIPRLIDTLFYVLIKEESWNFIKKYKNPTINFKLLKSLMIVKIKEVKKELF